MLRAALASSQPLLGRRAAAVRHGGLKAARRLYYIR